MCSSAGVLDEVIHSVNKVILIGNLCRIPGSRSSRRISAMTDDEAGFPSWEDAVETICRAASDMAWRHIIDARAYGLPPSAIAFRVEVNLLDANGRPLKLPSVGGVS
jgi:hypothetical protein